MKPIIITYEGNPCKCKDKHNKIKCRCKDHDVFEYEVIQDQMVVRQDLDIKDGIPGQQGAAFMFGKQLPDARDNSLYYNPISNVFSAGDSNYNDLDNLVYIGFRNTIIESFNPTIIGSRNELLRSTAVDVYGDDNMIIDSLNPMVFGNDNVIRSKNQVIVVGSHNRLAIASEGQVQGAIFGVRNGLLSDEDTMSLAEYYLSGLGNFMKSPIIDKLALSGIGNSIETTAEGEVISIYGIGNNVVCTEIDRHDSSGINNHINAVGLTTSDTVQHGVENKIEYTGNGETTTSNLMQIGTYNEIIGDFGAPRDYEISYMTQRGHNNIHSGFADNAQQTGDYNTEILRRGYKSSQTGHGNVTDRGTLTVAGFIGGEEFPETRLPDYDSSIDLVGTANILAIPNGDNVYFASLGTNNKTSIGGEGEDLTSRNVVVTQGYNNISISDPNTVTVHLLLGDDNTLFTRDAGTNIFEETPVIREVSGGTNNLDTDRSQLLIRLHGRDNTFNASGTLTHDTNVIGSRNIINLTNGNALSLKVEGFNNRLVTTESAFSRLSIEGDANNVISNRDTINNMVLDGSRNTVSTSTTDVLRSRNINVRGYLNTVIAGLGTAGAVCNVIQDGVSNTYVIRPSVDRRTGSITQKGTGNVIMDGDLTQVSTVGVDQTGASNYVVVSDGPTGYISQHGATNYTDVTGPLGDVNFPKRTVQVGGVIDLAPDTIASGEVNLQYEELRGYGFMDEPGNKSMFGDAIGNYGEGHVNANIIGASMTRSMVGRALASNAQEHNSQGSGYATMFSTEFVITLCRFVTFDNNGFIIEANGGDDIQGISSVNAGFRSFEQVVYPEDYYEVNNNQSTVFTDYNTKVDFMKDVLALFCCEGDYLDLTTIEELLAFARLNCRDAVDTLEDVDSAPDSEYTTIRPLAETPMDSFLPKSKQTNYVEVTREGVAYLEMVPNENASPGDRITDGPSGRGIVDVNGPYIYVNEPPLFGSFIPVTRYYT